MFHYLLYLKLFIYKRLNKHVDNIDIPETKMATNQQTKCPTGNQDRAGNVYNFCRK